MDRNGPSEATAELDRVTWLGNLDLGCDRRNALPRELRPDEDLVSVGFPRRNASMQTTN